jgi:hypothetical protein
MQTGIFDKTRLLANILMLVLVGLNIFFSIQYTQSIKQEDQAIEQQAAKTEERLKTSRFMKFFIDKVLVTDGVVSYDDRVKLEADVRAIGDPALTKQWDTFISSTDSQTAQESALKFMSILATKMI